MLIRYWSSDVCSSDLALNTMYMFITDHREAWASAYLPVNAALRALVGWVAVPTLTGPLLTLLGALALLACARRIWPANREAAVVALLLYAGTGQIWLHGMTAYRSEEQQSELQSLMRTSYPVCCLKKKKYQK